MHRVIITGKNSNFPHSQKSPAPVRCLVGAGDGRSVRDQAGRPPTSGIKPAGGSAAQLRIVQSGDGTNTVRRSARAPRPLQSPALTPNPERGTLADKIVEAATVIGGLAVFCAIAMFFLLLA